MGDTEEVSPEVLVDCPCQHQWLTGDYHVTKCPEAKRLRDAWCTPSSLTNILPPVDLDPASNERSTVNAVRSLCLERGEDGLSTPWVGSVFLNGPYSDLLPWMLKARRHWDGGNLTSFMALVKVDPTTEWWKTLTHQGPNYRLSLWLFNKRLQHDPPPRIRASTNNFPSALVHWHRKTRSQNGLRLEAVATLWT